MVTSDYRYHNDLDEDSYCNRRSVKWLTPNGIPRSEFSQSTLYELGAFISVFEIKSHTAQEILSHVQNGKTVKKISNAIEPINKLDKNIEDDVDDLTITKQASETAAETTQDYVIRLLQQKLSGHEFEKFIAHLIQCMGYNTRVTKKSGDGGVDIIAHKDALGFEPPIIKIQCKRTSGSSGEPEVSQLLGTLGDGEVALFINLGSYTTQAKNLEKNKSKLRLIDGNEVVDLIYKYYKDFEPQYRALIPLKQIFVPDISSMQ
ncbi:restriction endonuclease [Acinetobacter sp. 194]|nr:restriction endonuclease [Acinetobacter shaoyimingii]